MNEAALAVLTAMDKTIDAALKDVRADALDEMEADYAEKHAKSRELWVCGENVGSVGYKPPSIVPVIEAGSERTAYEWLYEHGLAAIKPVAGWDKQFEVVGDSVVHTPTGEVIPWLVPGTKRGYITVRIKDSSKTIEAARPLLDGGIAGLLGGADV